MQIAEVRKELNTISQYEVLLFGSSLNGTHREESDIDIAILARTEDSFIMKQIKLDVIQLVPSQYDVQIFESLPTIVKASILQSYDVLFGDPLEIGEYLYRYWKEWQDYSFRLEVPSVDEMQKSVNV